MAVIPEAITNPKPTPSHLLLRVSLLSLGAFFALSIVAPFVNAAHFSASIQRALEASLGRRVSFEKVYYRLLPVPGFSLENVTIGEDPRYGLEPFSYMDGLEARLRIDKLLLGQIRFASLRFIDPTLNMVKRDDGDWNVVEFVGRLTRAARPALEPHSRHSGFERPLGFQTRHPQDHVLHHRCRYFDLP